MTNKELRKKLLEDLGVTKQALSLKVKKLKSQYPMTTEDATYVIAQKQGLILDKYLKPTEIDRVREIMRHLESTIQNFGDSSSRKKHIKSPLQHKQIQIAGEFKITDPILFSKTINEAKEMAAIYPLLYILENSIREFIDKKITKLHNGKDWWESYATRGLKETVNSRMRDENKNSWHQRRGARPIDYLDLNQLTPLVTRIQNHVVPDVIPSLEWFSQLIDEVYQSRCVLCHMNPLDSDSIQSVKLRFKQWQKQIQAKATLLD
jgi:hypothetical protein